MKRLLLLTLLFSGLYGSNLLCQSAELTAGKAENISLSNGAMWAVADGENTLWLRSNNTTVATSVHDVVLLDKNYTEIKAGKADLKYKGTDLSAVNMISFGNKNIILALSGGRGNAGVCLVPFDAKSLSYTPANVISVCNITSQSRVFPPLRSEIFISENANYLLVIGASDNSNGMNTISMNVYNRELELVWQKEIKEQSKEQKYRIETAHIANNGEAYIALTENKNKGGKSDYLFAISVEHYKEKGSKMDKYVAPELNQNIFSIGLLVDMDGNIRVNGLYSKEDWGTFGGTFSTAMAKGNFKSEAFQINEVPTEIMALHLNKKQISKGSELRDYESIQYVILPNGISMITCERSVINGDPETYFYYETLVFGFDAQGAAIWTTPVMKYQSFGYMDMAKGSYQLFIEQDKLLVLFNDAAANADVGSEPDWDKVDKFRANSNGGIYMVAINSKDGSVTKSAVSVSAEQDLLLNISRSGKKPAIGSRIEVLNKKGKLALGKITVK